MINVIDLVGDKATACGATFKRRMSLGTRDGDPILGASFGDVVMTVRKKWAKPGATNADADVIAQVRFGQGVTVAEENFVDVEIDGAVLEVKPKTYVYDVWGTSLLGEEIQLVCGAFEVTGRATVPQ